MGGPPSRTGGPEEERRSHAATEGEESSELLGFSFIQKYTLTSYTHIRTHTHSHMHTHTHIYTYTHTAPDGGGIQHVGPGGTGGVLRDSPVLPLPKHPLPRGLEHGGRRERNQLPATVAA